MFTTINVILRNEDTQLYGTILPVALTNEDISNFESYKEYYAIASGTIPPKTKGSKKKANTDTTTKQKPPTAPKEKKEKKSGKGKQKTTELETISEASSGVDEGTGVTPGVPDAPDYDSEDDISWKSSDDDQDDEKAQDDEDEDKNDVNETTQDDEDDDEHDDDEEQTESEDDVHTPSHISSSDDETVTNEVEGMDVEGTKSDDDDTYVEDQGNEVVEDTNANLEGRDDVMTDAILPQVQATQEIEDTHVTLTPVNPDGQQQSSSVSSGFVSNMLNPNQDTGVDDIFEQHAEATSLIDTPVTAIVEPSFTAPTNRPPTPNPLVIQIQQPPILTPATTTSSSLQNLPNFASLFGFDYRLKALEDNFSELRQTNQYAEALSSIPGIVDQYLANKMQEAVDVAVQLKYDKIREESNTANQQFLDSIDEGMKKIIKEQVKKEVSKITPKIEKLVIDQLESEVLVRSSKEANTSHAVAANLSELELKKILIDKMEANNSINRSRHSKAALQGINDDQEPSAGTDRGSKRRRSGKEPASTSAPSETTTTTEVRKTLLPGVHDEQAEEEVQHLPDWFQQPTRLPSPDHAWNKSVPGPTKLQLEKLDWKQPRSRKYPHDLHKCHYQSHGKTTSILLDYCTKDTTFFNKFKEDATSTDYGIQDIEDMQLLLVARKIDKSQTRVEDLQLGVESYQKKLNLTKPEPVPIQSDKTRPLMTPTPDPRGDSSTEHRQEDRLMRIDELHKFSDGTLDDV
ncbi:hypothetical protein Tco_0591862 [Tanacetum coccineum]